MHTTPNQALPDVESYTWSEFQAAVLAAHPRTAVFDCDGTLWAPDAGYGFMLWSFDHKLVTDERRSWIQHRYRLYEAGAVDEATICGEMVQLYAGLRESTVRAAARAYFLDQIEPNIFPEMLALVAALQQAGTVLWAVSSTSRLVIEAGVWAGGQSPFQIPPERILAVEVASRRADEQTSAAAELPAPGEPSLGPVLTDRLLAVPTDEAKAVALRDADLPHPDVVFGNSIHDAAMLAIARSPFPVNPNSALAAHARSRGWRCYLPAAETKK